MTISEDVRVLGRLSYGQVVIVLLAGWAAWWFTHAVVNAVVGFVGLWLFNFDEQIISGAEQTSSSSQLGAYILQLRMMGIVLTPFINLASLIAGFWIAYFTFGRFKNAQVRNDSNEDSFSPSQA
ncbi:MAG: hypothetical protein OXG08_02525 [Gammaproteobacteria bacterium]|nr:hypothetical protein [Gammaproteobacteria bacterium]